MEKGSDPDYRAVVVVLARREDRIARVMRDRGKDRAYVESVMAAQVSDLERIRRADRLVLNTSDRQALTARALHALDEVLDQLEDSALR
ncbi:dephospho-CoA kinase [Brachybacterium sp. Z12]|uniref:dephospho-CoA kinase n=1 Tax=Brachybacterium sp. Z12 TaxID=2759167 RepID=UPI00223B8D94|nr:dephospho-CoA kinase [Brachybacterium sp. Z12]